MHPTQTDASSWDIPANHSPSADSLLECLAILTRHYGNPYSPESLVTGLPLQNDLLSPELFIRAAERAGLASKVNKKRLSDISDLVVPAVLLLKDKSSCVLLKIDHEENSAKIIIPNSGQGSETICLDKLATHYDGYVIYVREKHRYDSRTPRSLEIRSRHWFWGTILGSWKIYRDVLFASFLINIFVLVSPFFIMNIYDRVVPNQAFDTLWVLTIGILIAYTFDFILKMVRGYFIDIAGKKSDILISSRIMERVLGLRMSAMPTSIGTFSKHLQDFDSIRELITSSTVTVLIDLPFTLMLLAVIFTFGGSIVVAPIIGMLIIILYTIIIQIPIKKSVDKTLRSSAQKTALAIESLYGMEELKISQAEGQIQYKWEKVIGHIATWGVQTKLLSFSTTTFCAFITQLTTVCIVIVGVYLIKDGDLSMGGLIASTILSGRCLAPMGLIANLSTRYSQAKSALTQLNSIMEMELERPEGRNYVHRPNLIGNIEFDSVDFKYPKAENHSLRGVSLKIKEGEKIGIVGRIGSGKTTLEKLILGLYEPEAGAVRVDGIDLRQINPTDLRKCIGCVSQDITLFFGSIRDNITLGANHADDASILEAANISGVTEFADKHPQGLDMDIGERGQHLSGGQRQSIAIARALLMNPPILILDEPTSAMDYTSELRFKKHLSNINENKTLILISHKESMLELVDRLIVMDNGRIVADGPKDQVHAALKQGKLKIN